MMTPLFQAAFLIALASAIFLIGRAYQSDVTSVDLQWMFLPWLAAIFVPALAMQAFEDTPGDRRMELLTSLPVSPAALATGMWAAGLLVLLATLALTFPFPLTMAYLGDLDIGTTLAGYIGAIGYFAAVYAIALVAAASTREAIGGYVVGVIALLVLQLASGDAASNLLRGTIAAPLIDKLPYVTPGFWLAEFGTGRIALAGIVYLAGTTALALAATAFMIAQRRLAGRGLGQRLGLNRVLRAGTWVAAVFLLFAVCLHIDVGIDLTQEREFTLHPETREIAASAQPGTNIEVYWNASNTDIPAAIRQHAGRTIRLLKQIAETSDGRISLSLHEPAPDSEDEDQASLKGLQRVTLSAGGHFMLGAAFSQNKRQSAISYFAPDRAPVLEYDVAATLEALGRTKTPRIGILSPLLTPSNASNPREGLAFLEEIKRQYDVAIIPHFSDQLPENLDALIVMDATILKPEMLRQIDRHVMSGRGLIVMVDPFVRFNPASNAVVPQPGADINDVSDLLLRYGLRFEGNDVTGDPALASTVGAGDQRFLYPFWLRIRRPEFSPTQPAVAGLNELAFAEPGAFAIVDGAHAAALVTTSNRAGTLPRGEFKDGNPQTLASRLTSHGGSRIVAALIEGSLTSAFPQQAGARGAAGPAKTDNARIFAIADVDWLFDPLTYVQGGGGVARPLNDNIAALSNMIEAAAGHSDLAGIRSRGRLSRPFTRVADMLAASQERYREKEGELLGRISRVEDNIQKALQLSGAHTLDQLPDVIQGQVAELRRALLPFRRELRTLRQSMREDVERLGWWLTLLNLLAGPVLVIVLAGAVHAWRRRSLMRSLGFS
ncbi:MAG: Gldg family protein [Hyphomicrobiaceae bacterium]|nr:Gldg family protein [Hyphomicrobiaceae bacterium]